MDIKVFLKLDDYLKARVIKMMIKGQIKINFYIKG